MSRPRGPAPRAGGPAEAFIAERASAMPVTSPCTHAGEECTNTPPVARSRATGAAARTRRPPAVPQAPVAVASLAELQHWFHAVVTHPDTVQAGLALAAARHPALAGQGQGVVRESQDMAISERLGVYHFAYQARLVDCLADDFPTVKYALGEERFTALCRSVVAQRPSCGPNLNHYGKALLEHCRDPGTRLPKRAFIAELAELEWTMTEIFHAQQAPSLSLEQVQAVPLEQWADMRFAPSSSARVLRFTHPVNAYLQAYREDRLPGIPRPKASATAIYRVDFRIWRMDLTPPMADLLERLFAGEALGAALDQLAQTPGIDAEALGPQVMRWFREWVSGGFFVPRLDS